MLKAASTHRPSMAKRHDLGHDHGDHDHGDAELSITAKKASKVKRVVSGTSFSVEGLDKGSFVIASNLKELKSRMKSDADVVYDVEQGTLYLNKNRSKKGWGAKRVGGLTAKFKGKPELSEDNFDELTAQSIGAGRTIREMRNFRKYLLI